MIGMRLVQLAVAIASVSAFSPSRFASRSRGNVEMAAETSASKYFGAAVIAASMFSMPVLATEGAGPKYSFFGSSASSPFVINENREDPMYSPYSPYGNGKAAVYNNRKGGAEEVAFYKTIFDKSMYEIIITK
jgi:hypothetical protein